MGGRTFFLCGAAAMALLLQSPAPASPQPDPGLWLIGADGSGAREVDADVDRGYGYDWSPDGAFLAYGTGDIWVLDVALGETVNLTATPTVNERHPSWSPDGSRVAFARDDDVWIMDADGTDASALTAGEAYDGRPSWAPAGNLIAFERRVAMTQNPTLHVVDAGGGAPRPLVEVRQSARAASWSPDGRELAFTSPLEEVQVVDVTTGAVALLAEQGYSPAWAPVGDRIAYAGRDGLFVVSRVGGPPTRLRERGPGPYEDISWSPDGRSIAVGGYDVEVIDASTGSSVALTTDQPTEEEHSPLWSPPGDLIAYVGEVWCCLPHYWERRIEVTASGHLVVRGGVDAASMEACAERVPVNVRRRHEGGWRTVKRTRSTEDGSFEVRLPDRPGRYFITTPEVQVTSDEGEFTCLWSRSEVVKHRH